MRTATAARLLELVRQTGGARPKTLAERLAISPQALHRHLRAFTAAGRLERRGRGPKTLYALAGSADWRAARDWHARGRGGPGAAESLCESRDVLAARLGRLAALARRGVPETELALLISAAGEVGNNCFDHNLGQWRDAPGCWFEVQMSGGRVWVCFADRGQGVLGSLSRVDPSLRDDQQALTAAFERRISGRAPEQRGNGLKFVRRLVTDGKGRGVACRSGAGVAAYGERAAECREEAARFSAGAGGTATVLVWSVP